MRWAPLLLLCVGCSLEVKGRAESRNTEDAGDDAASLDARVAEDGSAQERDGALQEPGGNDAASGDGDGDAPGSHDDAGSMTGEPDASTPVKGHQPPPGQIGSRCKTDECSKGPGNMGAWCALSGEAPIGSDTGYCTRSCGAGIDNPCGPGAICVSINNVATCQRTCKSDADCRIEDGYYCASTFPLLLYVCWHR